MLTDVSTGGTYQSSDGEKWVVESQGVKGNGYPRDVVFARGKTITPEYPQGQEIKVNKKWFRKTFTKVT